jgi:trimeric autotransporter adhesin
MGSTAGVAITTGNNNIAIGYLAMDAETTGSRAVAIGTNALGSQNGSGTDNYNIGIGYDAGGQVTTGVNNTFVGGLAGDAADDASNCVAIGKSALSANCGDGNTAVGAGVLNLTTAANNTAVGADAGIAVTSGGNNLLLGHDAGRTGSPGGNITTASNILSLGDENIATANIQVDWTVASDARDKTDFTALDLGLDFVKALAPVTYKWDKRSKYGDKSAEDYDLNAQTPDGTHKEDWLDIGFKAQEVEALEIAAGYNKDNKTNLVSSHTDDGKQMGLQYSKFVPILVKAIQDQQAIIDSLTTRIEALES